MNKIIEELNSTIKTAFINAGFDVENISVQPCSISSLGDFQCSSALALAKQFSKAPLFIAEEVIKHLPQNSIIASAELAKPGYINIFVDNNFLNSRLALAYQEINTPLDAENQKTIIDYGGPNVAKPLHVGHLRSGTIGEAIKRICKFVGNPTIGDVHFGDWGLPIGMVISELERLHPEWVYFDPNFNGEYPENPPFTNQDIENTYPEASKKAKADENLMKIAQTATVELQEGRRGYVALWNHIMQVSKADVREIYGILNIDFELWLGESDTQKACTPLIEKITQSGHAHKSQGALVIDVAESDDKIEVPPFMLQKSDGGITYATTDLATIIQREQELGAKRIIYIVDKRQDLHFTQVFRAARKTGLVSNALQLDFVGFGTMNGKDGKPYKTRDGGVMQLKVLINETKAAATKKIEEAKGGNIEYSQEEMALISERVAVAALKFADLSIYRSKNYIFDVEKFCSFEGKTGPYILYTITRAKSILRKANYAETFTGHNLVEYVNRELLLTLLSFKTEILKAHQELAPSVLCDYVYRLANQFNSFYTSCNIINEPNQNKKSAWLYLTNFTLKILEKCFDLLGIKTLEKM